VYISLCSIWIIILVFSNTVYHKLLLKITQNFNPEGTMASCPKLMLMLITNNVLSSSARQNHTFSATSRRKGRIRIAHHLHLIERHHQRVVNDSGSAQKGT